VYCIQWQLAKCIVFRFCYVVYISRKFNGFINCTSWSIIVVITLGKCAHRTPTGVRERHTCVGLMKSKSFTWKHHYHCWTSVALNSIHIKYKHQGEVLKTTPETIESFYKNKIMSSFVCLEGVRLAVRQQLTARLERSRDPAFQREALVRQCRIR
jgi:hypothetical protein